MDIICTLSRKTGGKSTRDSSVEQSLKGVINKQDVSKYTTECVLNQDETWDSQSKPSASLQWRSNVKENWPTKDA